MPNQIEKKKSLTNVVLTAWAKEADKRTKAMSTNPEPTLPVEETQNDVTKLLIEKVALATSRFIKGEITREQREAIYDEAYLGFSQLQIEAITLAKQQERERLAQLIASKSKRPKDKIKCNCPCKTAFCDDLIHPCDKPGEHYTQREALLFDFVDGVISDLRKLRSK